MKKHLIGGLCCLLLVASSVIADETSKVEIEAAIQSYASAFNARDAKTLAEHWSPEGVYTSRQSGQEIVGRAALEKEFTALFADQKDTKLELATESIDFVSPNVAIEAGEATVIEPNTEPIKSRYSVVYTKREGKWLIDRVSETEVPPTVSSHYEQLEVLEWMVGNWVDRDGEITIKTTCKWTRNQNFITRSFTASNMERVDMTGMQFLGWDAANKRIQSWTFDSAGGTAQGIWQLVGKNWIVKSTATLADGRKASSTTVFRSIDGNSFGWQKTDRVVDGEILPNIDEVIIVREDIK